MMGKGSFLAAVALLIAVAGAVVAFAAYFKRRSCTLCDEFGDDLMDDELADLDYYATQVDEDENLYPSAAAPQPDETEEEVTAPVDPADEPDESL